jgi:2,4-dienoyl-CoA reductase-like NADH-dependent reductase (Old Yellow Enzyme family)
MSILFERFSLGKLQLKNRIIIAPMCQYSAVDGNAQDWHLIHLGSLALSGAGLLILEATAVSPEGRISPGDLGLFCDENEDSLLRVLEAIRKYSDMPLAIQLGHAGRKGSSEAPWDGGAQIAPAAPRGWKTLAPSEVLHAEGEDVPRELDEDGLLKIKNDFVLAAQRAERLGLDGIEIHMAHGYLLHQFLSPLSNKRTDAYGGSLENRIRFPLEVFDAIKAAVSLEMPVWVRVSATDWVPYGWDVEDTLALSWILKERGCAAIHVSSGGVSPKQEIKLGPGYQVSFAERIKAEIGLPTIAVGLITEAAQAEEILQKGQADAIALARGMLYDPRWPWHAAAELGAQVNVPKQYWRCQPNEFRNLFKGMKIGHR